MGSKGSQVRREVDFSYAFKHRKTGRILRLKVEHSDSLYASPVTYMLSLTVGETFKLGSEYEIATALQGQKDWMATSMQRPHWCSIDPKDVEVILIQREMEFAIEDPDGADPMFDLTTVRVMPRLEMFARVIRLETVSRDKVTARAIERAFGLELSPQDIEKVDVVVLDPKGGYNVERFKGFWVMADGEGRLGRIRSTWKLSDQFPSAAWSGKGPDRRIIALLDCSPDQSVA